MITTTQNTQSGNHICNIVCTSTTEEEKIAIIIEYWNKLVEKTDLSSLCTFRVIENIASSSEDLMRLSTNNTVVFFEKVNQSKYSQIRKLIDLIKRMGKPVLGVVLFEADPTGHSLSKVHL